MVTLWPRRFSAISTSDPTTSKQIAQVSVMGAHPQRSQHYSATDLAFALSGLELGVFKPENQPRLLVVIGGLQAVASTPGVASESWHPGPLLLIRPSLS